MIQLSIDESIKRLKMEIIAQDWGLSEKRIELLEAAFACLKQRFKSRKAAHSILIMAGSVLEYVKRRGENTPSESIDFLKEAMAHIVNLYESDEFDPDKDEKLFKGLYFRFNVLKEKIKAEKEKTGSEQPAAVEAAPDGAQPPERDEFDEDILVPENIERLRKKVFNLKENDLALDRGEVDRLVSDLQTSLERAEYVGETIRELLNELLRVRRAQESGAGPVAEEIEQDEEAYVEERAPEERDFSPFAASEDALVKNCPATEVRGMVLSGSVVYMQENAISLIRDVSKDRLREYLKNSSVPLAHFGGFFKRLSRQFKGSLATIADKKLRKLSLPIMIPTGFNLNDMPDENGQVLVFVTNGQWNGVLVCSEVDREPVTMVKFRKAKNGDFVGIGYAENGVELPLLNAVSVLRREGFLTMV
ncbi:MAG: hypothetical protein ACOY32_07890 [Thermodesulfobacteriota bacterium]